MIFADVIQLVLLLRVENSLVVIEKKIVKLIELHFAGMTLEVILLKVEKLVVGGIEKVIAK